MTDIEGPLGVAFGALIAALRGSGWSEDDVRLAVEMAFRTYAATVHP